MLRNVRTPNNFLIKNISQTGDLIGKLKNYDLHICISDNTCDQIINNV